MSGHSSSVRTLRGLVESEMLTDTALERLRQTLAEDDADAVVKVMRAGADLKTGAGAVGQISPMEKLLLLTAARQLQQIERLELLVQRLSARVLELYGEGRGVTNVEEEAREVLKKIG